MESIILRYGLSFLTVILILMWYYLPADFLNAKAKFQAAVKENPFGDYEQPRMAQTLGVFGTFVGITIGLLSFDPSPANMQNSVTNLLGGMTTAFLTSILGMWLSFCMKRYQEKLQMVSTLPPTPPDASIADLIQFLKNSDAEKTQLLKDTAEKLTHSLVGNGEDTVIGQIKFIRLEMRDNFSSLKDLMRQNNEQVIRELQDFGKTLADNNAKAFIEALNETMKDFNNKLTEQFGENFKQLNVAVGKLLEWQIHYRETLETVTHDLEIAFAGIDAAKNSIAAIEESADAIHDSSSAILDLIVTANTYERQLEEILRELRSLGEDAKDAVPNIVELVQTSCAETQRHAAQATQNVNFHVEAVVEKLSGNLQGVADSAELMANNIHKVGNSALNRIDDTTNKTIASMSQVAGRIESTSRKQQEIMDTAVQTTTEAVKNAAAALREDSFKITESISNELHTMMKNNNEAMKTAIENHHNELNQKMKDSLESFGKVMLQILKKFTDDYGRLFQVLNRFIELTERIEGRRQR